MPTRRQLANALRVLAMDAIEKAQSGHPGAPLGMADMAEALWRHGFKHNPANPTWIDRDRFILSNGHASMLLYGLLYLSGYALSLEDIQNFRQLGSKTPGHPEFGVTPGVDATTGPLGQGLASAVGMALAERMLAKTFNRPGFPLIDHYTYCFCGDGCLMEGVSQEACSLAGTWKLGKLIVYYDANGISIDGKIDAWFGEDVAMRFRSMSWHVLDCVDGHDPAALDAALLEAKANQQKPSLIICKTHIGYGSTKEDSAASHGSPLGEESIAAAKKAYGWSEKPFRIPEDIRESWDARESGKKAEDAWQTMFSAYCERYPRESAEFLRRIESKLPDDWEQIARTMCDEACKQKKALATRKASQKCLSLLIKHMPELIGGSADLTGSVGTMTEFSHPLDVETYAGNYLYYGVREFAMCCIMNGLTLHKGFIPYAGTFLSFVDQAKNAVRLAALMHVHAIYVFTHDSIGVGEDGPTHQPVEQIASLRLIPNLTVWRPCDSVETAVAWKYALEHKEPTALILSRQSLPSLERKQDSYGAIERGGYILRDCEGTPKILLLATGSEIQLAEQCFEKLSEKGIAARVIAMPSTEVFDTQEDSWKEYVLPKNVRARLAIEAASPEYWYKYVGLDGAVVGMSQFGVSGTADAVREHFGFTVENVVSVALKLLAE